MEGATSKNYKHAEEDEAAVLAMAACSSYMLPMTLNAAVELDLFEIIAGAGDGAHLSASDVASRLTTAADGAAVVLGSMMQLLAANSLLTCSVDVLADGGVERRYGLSPAGKFFAKDEGGASLCQSLSFTTRVAGGALGFSVKDLVLFLVREGGNYMFERMYVKSFYELITRDVETGKLFNDSMGAHSAIVMKKVVKTYRGFEGLSRLVDVGGGGGSTLDAIVSEYPSIHGVNFDLPHVVNTAPSYNNIEHIGGDMFLEVPKGDAILLKNILHNWGDEHCVNILKCCYKSMPNEGKLIVMDYILPNTTQTDVHAKYASQMNLTMKILVGGKERTEDEFQGMATAAGFVEFKVVCSVYGIWIMEFIKLV
ncbi:hypothetical protein ABFS83_03G108000 [Erythranthe nasuta]